MVTRILFDPRVDLPDGTTGSSPVIVEATPTGIRADGSVFVLPTTLSFTISTPADQLLLAAPAASWGWNLAVRRAGAMLYGASQAGSVLARRTVTWTDTATTTWAALTDLDPATLEPTAATVASWAAAQELAQSVRDELDALTAGAPSALDTFLELASQLGADETGAAALAALVGTKATPAQITAAISALNLGTASTHAATDFDPAGAAGAVTLTSLGGSPLACVPSVAFLGHSMPYQAGGLYSNIDAGSRYYPNDSYIAYAQMLSDGRWLHDGTQALSGATIQDVLTTHLPALLARADRPDYCVVHIGQNDVSTLTGQDFTDLATIYSTLRAAGVEPIAVTEVASVTAPGGTWKLNQWITRHAREHGIALVDFYGATADPATGTYLAGYSGDGIHPTGPGAFACGQTLADILTGRLPDTSTTALLARTDLAAVSSTLLIGVPTFQTDDGGPPPVTAPWQVRPSGSTFTTVAGIPGRVWTLVTANGAGGADSYAPFTPAVSAGDRLLVGFRLATEVEHVGGSWQIELQQTDNGGPHFHIGGTQDVPWSTFAFETIVPSGIPNLRMQPRASGPDGSALHLAQLTIVNLTTQQLV